MNQIVDRHGNQIPKKRKTIGFKPQTVDYPDNYYGKNHNNSLYYVKW